MFWLSIEEQMIKIKFCKDGLFTFKEHFSENFSFPSKLLTKTTFTYAAYFPK